MKISDRVMSQWYCQLCGESPRRKTTPHVKLVIDHDHSVSPKRARGRLCHRCNIGLGYLERWIAMSAVDIVMGYVVTHGFEKQSFEDWYQSDKWYPIEEKAS